MKRRTALIAVILVLALAVSCLYSCDNSGATSVPDSNSSDNSASESGTTSGAESDDGIKPYIPAEKYDNSEFLIFSFTSQGLSVGYSHFGNGGDGVELESNTVNEAITERNYYVEEELGVTIKEMTAVCDDRGVSAAYNSLTNMIDADTDRFNLVCPSMYSAAALSQNGYLTNLLDLEYLHNLEASWWDKYFVEDITIGDRLDFVTGDMCMYARTGIFLNFFNKELFKQYDLQEPYALVREHKWTLDKVYEMSKTMAEELNGDGKIDYNDLYGFGGQHDTMVFWFYSFGGRIVSKDADGKLEMTMYNDKTVDYVEKLREFMLDDTCYVSANDYFNVSGYKFTPSEYIFDAFANNHSLFLNAALTFMDRIGNIKSDFGVLPTPLFDENQEDYVQALNCWNAQPIGIPSYLTAEEIKYSSIVTEALGEASEKIVVPAFYEKTLQKQKTRDDDSIEMLDIVFNGLGTDLAHVYNWGNVGFALNDLVSNTTLEFTSFYQSFENGVKAAMEKTMEIYEN